VRRPRAVVPRVHLPQLVLAHQLQRRLVRRRVVLDRNLSRLQFICTQLPKEWWCLSVCHLELCRWA
jgi:hypothetical protein